MDYPTLIFIELDPVDRFDPLYMSKWLSYRMKKAKYVDVSRFDFKCHSLKHLRLFICVYIYAYHIFFAKWSYKLNYLYKLIFKNYKRQTQT